MATKACAPIMALLILLFGFKAHETHLFDVIPMRLYATSKIPFE
jgi:hypothetical protein